MEEYSVLDYLHFLLDKTYTYLPTLLSAVAVFVIGFWIAGLLDKGIGKYFKRRDYDVSLEGFFRSLVNIGLKIVVIITVAGMIGLPTASLLAVFGAAGLAIGLALQGSLSNFAGGVLILIFKPFKVGDVITSQGETGEVKEIQIFNTLLLTPENKTVILANGAVSNGTIVNNTRHGNLRASLRVAIDFEENIENVKALIMEVLLNEPLVLQSPAPTVLVLEYGEAAVVLSVRPYAKTPDYGIMQSVVLEKIHRMFIEQKIKRPPMAPMF